MLDSLAVEVYLSASGLGFGVYQIGQDRKPNIKDYPVGRSQIREYQAKTSNKTGAPVRTGILLIADIIDYHLPFGMQEVIIKSHNEPVVRLLNDMIKNDVRVGSSLLPHVRRINERRKYMRIKAELIKKEEKPYVSRV